MPQVEVPGDWYRFAYPPEMAKLPWAQKTVSEVERVIAMLQLRGEERILDLACGTGRHTVELARRGFQVVGVELLAENVEVARVAAKQAGVEVEFIAADLRELSFQEEFDVVLSLNDGAIGYFESEAENVRAFEVIASTLRSSGRHLLQIANVLHAEKFMPMKGWIESAEALEVVDHYWNPHTRCWEGATAAIPVGEVFEKLEFVPFRKRLYSVTELQEIYASFGMTLANVFRGNGRPGKPRSGQYEIFAEARRD